MTARIDEILPGRARGVAIVLGAGLILVLTPGVIDGLGIASIPAFDFGAELKDSFNVPTLFSVGLLAIAGALALRAASLAPEWRDRLVMIVLAAGLFAAAVDEWLGFHERFEPEFASGVAEASVWVGLVLVGAAVWLAVTATIWSLPAARRLWLAGGFSWFLAIAADELPNPPGGRTAERAIDGLEELLEMVGSSLLILALLVIVEQWLARASVPAQDGGAGREPRRSG